MDEDLAKRLKYLLHSANQYSVLCPQLSAHLTERFATLRSKAGLNQLASCAGSSSKSTHWCPRCSTLFTPSSAHWRTLPAKTLRSKRRRCCRGNRQGIHWLDKPLPKHNSYVVVDCHACGGSFIAGGLNKPSSNRKKSSSVKSFKTNLVKRNVSVKTAPTSPAVLMPKEQSFTHSNRGQSGSTPSNQQRRRSSTLKAQLARSSSQQRQRHGQGNSPKLSAFLTSVQ